MAVTAPSKRPRKTTASGKKSRRRGAPVSVVFGGMRGLACNVARMFHRRGHRVIVVDRRAAPETKEKPFYHHALQADLADVGGIPALAKRIGAVYGGVDNLVFSLRYRGPATREWDGEIALGLTMPKMMIEALTPRFGRDGAVLLISSTAAHKVTAGLPLSYHCVKAATEHMVRYYAWHLGKRGIRVNGIAPGYMVKDESMPFFTKDPKKMRRVSAMHPVGRFGRADDIARAACFLCSDDASFITGQILTVDGGLSLENPGYS